MLQDAAGKKTRPACSGVSPRCCCRNRLTKKTAPEPAGHEREPDRQRDPHPADWNNIRGIIG
jgi:hypothetical protein